MALIPFYIEFIKAKNVFYLLLCIIFKANYKNSIITSFLKNLDRFHIEPLNKSLTM